MRKYDIKNKRNIGIIIVISIVIIIMFSLFIRFFLSFDKKEYNVLGGTLVFDVDKSIIKLGNDGVIKTKWNDEYYLIYDDKDYELGDTAISYNENTGEIVLYGRYYEIGSGDEINVTDDETVIKSSALTKFYKLADRKYLVIDTDIKSADGLLSTSEFLMVDLDKVGNATLTNHKVSLKVFSSSTIVTSNYTFDIANEILTYGSDKIDLKKIIGSSNTYTKEELVPEINTDNDSSNDIIVDNNTGNNEVSNGNNNVTIEEVKKHTKKTSVIAVNSSTNKINIDYVIYDPKKEYTSVYMEINEFNSSNITTYYLSSSDTSVEISDGIFPGATYEIKFKYSYLDENGNMKIDVFEDLDVITKIPNMDIKVTRVSGSNINYLITTDNSYPINEATLKVMVNGELLSNKEMEISGNKTGNEFISELSEGDVVELIVDNVKSNGRVINGLSARHKFEY